MAKIHARIKRRFGLSTSLSHHRFFHPGIKKNKPKTFKTEEAANSWALNRGLKEGQYYLKRVKRGKKLQVVACNGKDKNTANKENNP